MPNAGLLLILAAAVVLGALLAFLRFTRYGLVIRAGVENREMVTALGIDVRKAFTLVFAIGGAAAALAGALGGVYFGIVSPGQGGSLLIFAFIVVVIGGMGSVVGSAYAAVAVGLRAAVRQLLRHGRRSATSAWSRCWPIVLLCAAAGHRRKGGDGMTADRRRSVEVTPPRPYRRELEPRAALASCPLRAAASRWSWRRSCRTPRCDIPGLFDGPLNSPGTLQLLAICLVFGGLAAGYDLLFGRTGMLSFGHALYFAAGVYGTDILVTRAGLPLWQAALLAITGSADRWPRCSARSRCARPGIAFAMVTLAFAQVGAILVARDFGGLTGGEEGLPLDGRRAAAPSWWASRTRSTCTGWRWRTSPWSCSWCTGWPARRPGGCSPGCATTSAGSACSASTRTASSWWRSRSPAAWRRPAAWSTCWSSAAPRRT